MRRSFLAGAVATLVASRLHAQSAGAATRIDFESPVSLQTMLTGGGGPVAWSIVNDPSAPAGPRVLAQTSKDTTDHRFPLAVFDQPVLQDLEVAIRFKPISGTIDRAAGIAVRLADRDNYYVVRANALENNVRLYNVVAGDRRQFAGASAKVQTGVWQELRLAVRGNRFEVFFEGRSLYGATDPTFAAAGRLALWTKADSVTYFDDVRIA